MELVADTVTVAGRPKLVAPRVPEADGLLQPLLDEAARRRATHIHVDPSAGGADITLRIGGQRADGGTLPHDRFNSLSAEAFQAANLETGVAKAQHGVIDKAGYAVTVSIMPAAAGGSLVFKLDPGEKRDRHLEALGLRPPLIAVLRPSLAKGGLVLVAGPAGSGRSTTMRALLDHLGNKARRGILAEQLPGAPMPGVTQVPVTPECTMADILRAAAHHDADIVVADGLSDRASTAAAVEAAQAGVLVLAAVPAADAVGAIRQMREWRVESFQFASILNVVLAQRLVRRLCPACREPIQAQGSVSALLGFDRGAIVYSPTGCVDCGGSGYAGQIAVFEAIHADPVIRRLINDGGDEAILARHAYLRAPNLGSSARTLVREGITTPHEAVRISRN